MEPKVSVPCPRQPVHNRDCVHKFLTVNRTTKHLIRISHTVRCLPATFLGEGMAETINRSELNNFCRILTMVCWYWTNCTFGLYPTSGVSKIWGIKIYIPKNHNTHVQNSHKGQVLTTEPLTWVHTQHKPLKQVRHRWQQMTQPLHTSQLFRQNPTEIKLSSVSAHGCNSEATYKRFSFCFCDLDEAHFIPKSLIKMAWH
jgi:hypothetical protein